MYVRSKESSCQYLMHDEQMIKNILDDIIINLHFTLKNEGSLLSLHTGI